jgi:hypothetical protein
MGHLALLGDSIFDNRPYTAPEPDTTDHLQRALGPEWTVELLARDGATMADLGFQLAHLGAETDFAVLSIGGNDAIEHIGILEPRVCSSTDMLGQLADISDDFGRRYAQVLADLRPRVQRLVPCTIYEPPMGDLTTARLARIPLSLLNDQILRCSLASGLDVLDLRTVCTETSDFVKEIEPSAGGAWKIASAIAALVRDATTLKASRLFAG